MARTALARVTTRLCATLHRGLPLGLLVASVAFGAACNEEKAKPKPDEPKKASPVPSDMVFNDFLPSGGSAAGLAVKLDGGGGEGGALAAGGGGGEEPAGEEKFKVVDAGADPKAPRKYAFVANRVEKRVVTSTRNVTREGGGADGAQDMTNILSIDLTPKAVKPNGSKWEVKITKLELPGAAPPGQQAALAKQLQAVEGLGASFDVSTHGDISEMALAGDDRMKGPMAEQVVGLISQVLDLFVVPFPDQPIGVGAKWERVVEKKEGPITQKGKHAFTLKEVTAEGGVVESEVEIKVPKSAVQMRGAPPGTTVEIDAKGKYLYTFRFDRAATKVDGELVQVQTIELSDGKQKQKVKETQKAKTSIASPGAGGASAGAPTAAAPKAP